MEDVREWPRCLTCVPQLVALLAHILKRNPCSEAFRIVKIPKTHRYTFLGIVLALLVDP